MFYSLVNIFNHIAINFKVHVLIFFLIEKIIVCFRFKKRLNTCLNTFLISSHKMVSQTLKVKD